jgi:AcrR family transcriptional regulator
MSPRRRIPDETLLDAARAVFVEQGVHATTAAVAARAGVSEALLFKRFGTRDALFAQATGGSLPGWVALLDAPPTGPLPALLDALAHGMIAHLREEMPRSMLRWSREPGRAPFDSAQAAPVAGTRRLAAFFEQQMRAGRMRATDPELFARVFSGAIVAFAMGEMTGLAAQMPLDTPTFVRGMVDTLWRGAAPEGPHAP